MTIDVLTATATDLQSQLNSGAVSSRHLIQTYLSQVTKHNDYLRAVIAIAPENLLYARADALDDERSKGRVRGPLHGIPVLLKDNIATDPELELPTTCGSLALVGSKPRKSASLVDQLIMAGAIIFGKANLSEWAWYRSDLADSGWSAVGGQTQSPYVRGGFRKDDTGGGHSNPGGSSSGSAAAVAAGFVPIAVGTETMGSLIMPSDRAALYTIKPTLKLIAQDGIIPITHEADSAGPMTKSVKDLANLLDVLVDPNYKNLPEGGYISAATGDWGDIKIGIVEPEKWLFPEKIVKYEKSAMDQMMREWKAAYDKLKTVVKVVKPVHLVSIDEATEGGKADIWNAFHMTFKGLLEDYLASVDDCRISTLQDLINFNEEHADEELPPCADNQAGLIRALNYNMTMNEYNKIIRNARDACGKRGVDRVLEENDVDIILGPGDGPMFHIPGTAGKSHNLNTTPQRLTLPGYPSASLPLGYLDFNGRAFGMQITAKAHQEALLIQAQSAWEATFPARRPPNMNQISPKLA